MLGSGDLVDEGVLGSEHHVGGAEEGIGTGGEDFDDFGFVTGDFKLNLRSFAATDPVALESFDGFRPIEWLELIDEALGVIGDA